MRLQHKLLATAIMLAAGCSAGSDKAETPTDAPDFRDGSYHYVLGYDPETGEQIRGGAHAVVGFDENGKTEPIDSANRVARFHPDVTESSDFHRYDASLTQGETDWEVFPSTWWPQSRNGTAWRWQPGSSDDYNDRSDVDRLSPMEKWDMLFNPGEETVVEAVSHCEYQDYVDDPDNCEEIEHPELTVAGPATAWELENQGVYQWVEPENWWGHCNGWASYATTEPLGYPRRDIRVRLNNGQVEECTDDTEGCVLWRMADIEALFTELYFSDRATFSGRRCNTRPDEIERDEFGRPTEDACRDVNPGSFHVAIVGMFGHGARNLTTNEMGRPAFVIDHNWDHEIWNFPVVSYEINSQADVTEEEAHELVGGEGSDYQWNANATRFVRVQLTYEMISDGVPAWDLVNRADQRSLAPVPVELNYVLELDDNDQILGGEWIDDPVVTWGENSKELHPDFIWMATDPVGWGEGADDLGGNNDNPYISLSGARQLLRCANEPESCAPAGGGGGGGGGTLINVTDLVARDAELDFDTGVVEPGRYTITLSHTDSNPGGDADLYVRVGSAPTTSGFDCRPYLNGSDEVCTVQVTEADTIHIMVRGYSFGDNHFGLTVVGDGDGGGGGGGGEEWDGLTASGTVARNAEDRYETPELPAGTYRFEITGTADADLYVRTGAAPTTSAWDCRPYMSGSAETCTVTLTAPSVIHAMVRGWADSSTYELTAARQ